MLQLSAKRIPTEALDKDCNSHKSFRRSGKNPNALKALEDKGFIKKDSLNGQQLDWLTNFFWVQTQDGGLLLQDSAEPDEQAPSFNVHENGVRIHSSYSIDSPEGINEIFRGAMIYKGMWPDGKVFLKSHNGQSELDDMVFEYASRKAGLDVQNPPEKRLEEVNPALAEKIDQAWAKMNGRDLTISRQPVTDRSEQTNDRGTKSELPCTVQCSENFNQSASGEPIDMPVRQPNLDAKPVLVASGPGTLG